MGLNSEHFRSADLLKIKNVSLGLRKKIYHQFRLKSTKTTMAWRSLYLMRGRLYHDVWKDFTHFFKMSNSGLGVVEKLKKGLELFPKHEDHPYPKLYKAEGRATWKPDHLDLMKEELSSNPFDAYRQTVTFRTKQVFWPQDYTNHENKLRGRRSKTTMGYKPKVPNYRRPLHTSRYKTYFKLWWRFLSVYRQFNNYSFLTYFHYTQSFSQKHRQATYHLMFNFRRTRLFINLKNGKHRNYLSLTLGLFLKFFKNKKSLKKNKVFKFLLIKYLRKILILANLKNIYLRVKKTPIFLQELMSLLTKPLVSLFKPVN